MIEERIPLNKESISLAEGYWLVEKTLLPDTNIVEKTISYFFFSITN
jgi:hypothetical protein